MYVNNNPSVGDTLQVRITAKQSYGVFVRMPNGRDGLIRLNDISWQNQAKILGQLSVGEVFMAKVIKELPDGKLNLSRRELLPNPRTLETLCSAVSRLLLNYIHVNGKVHLRKKVRKHLTKE